MTDSEDFFLKQMKGVNPIKKNNKVEKKKPKAIKNFLIKDKEIKNNNKILKTETKINITKSDYILENVNIKKSIKKGSFKIDKKIDFHGKTLIESEEYFYNTVLSCYDSGLRCLLFITGKGLFKIKDSNTDKPKLYHGVIRSAFTSWVKSNNFSKYILSYEPSSIEHGGDGAFYVYLRKKKN